MSKGLFVGMVTLDLIYLAERLPKADEKIVAINAAISAGGPATNAAVTFNYLGNHAVLTGAIGSHPISHLILTDLQEWGIAVADLAPTRTESPPVSSIIVTRSTGERAVVSINATTFQAERAQIPADLLDGVNIVLIDGHQMEVGAAIAQFARQNKIPVVMDGGSWKPGFETVLPWVDYAICSANFYPPRCQTSQDAIEYLTEFGIQQIAITQGGEAIRVWHSSRGTASVNPNEVEEIAVPRVPVIDTLGAGDIFHGAFCHFILHTDFKRALSHSAHVAARSCQSFGTRNWMRTPSV
jgi:sugar/nucleoside kinase (ribokinase family)